MHRFVDEVPQADFLWAPHVCRQHLADLPDEPCDDPINAAEVGDRAAGDVRLARLQHAGQGSSGTQFERHRDARLGGGVHAVVPHDRLA